MTWARSPPPLNDSNTEVIVFDTDPADRVNKSILNNAFKQSKTLKSLVFGVQPMEK